MTSQHINHKLQLLPDLPGCYIMKNKEYEIIYMEKLKTYEIVYALILKELMKVKLNYS